MKHTKPQPPAPVPAIKTLEYDNKSPHITRNQMRFFLLLLTINTFLFAAFICLPSASPFIKQMWADHQAKREAEREAANLKTLINACMNFNEPPDTLVYAEPPPDAVKLLNQAGRSLTIVQLPSLNRDGGGGGGGLFGGGGGAGGNDTRVGRALASIRWQSPSLRGRCQALIALDTAKGNGSSNNPMGDITDDSVVFLHEMTTPSGFKRLVWIAIDAHQDISVPDQMRERDTDTIYSLWTNRKISAHVFDSDFKNTSVVHTSALLTSPLHSTLTIDSKDLAELKSHGLWRIYAGQPDPKNPSHLTIAYDIDGKPGVIDGWLKDGDRLMLEPRTGHLVNWTSGSEYTWDLSPTATTNPAK